MVKNLQAIRISILLLLGVLLFAPEFVHADTCYVASGFDTSVYNGTYEYQDSLGGSGVYNLVPERYKNENNKWIFTHTSGQCFGLDSDNTNGAFPDYYNCGVSGASSLQLSDIVNGTWNVLGGSGSAGTFTESSCSPPPPPPPTYPDNVLYSYSEPGDTTYGLIGVPINSDSGFIKNGVLSDIYFDNVINSGSDLTGYFYLKDGGGITLDCRTPTVTLSMFGFSTSDFGSVHLPFTGAQCDYHTFSDGALNLYYSTYGASLGFRGGGGIVRGQVYSGGLPVDLTKTRIISYSPALHSNVSTTTFALSSQIYINPIDYDSDLYLEVTLKSASCGLTQGMGSSNVNQVNSGQSVCTGYYDFPITSSGASTFSTSTVNTSVPGIVFPMKIQPGLYDYTWTITKPSNFLFWSLFKNSLISVSGSFIVGSSSDMSLIDRQVIASRALANELASKVASSTDCVELVKHPFSSSTVSNLVGCLFLPDTEQSQTLVKSLRENLLTKVPFGYLTRLTDIIIGSSATSTLPLLRIVIPDNLPAHGAVIDFTPWQGIRDGFTKLQNSTTTEFISAVTGVAEGDNPYDYLYSGWVWLNLLFFAWYVIKEILHFFGVYISPAEDNDRYDVRKMRLHEYSRDIRNMKITKVDKL